MRKRRKMTAFLLLCGLLLGLARPVRAEEGGYLALTFDDGPSGRFTRRLLEGLEEREAKATFFLCGYRMAFYQELTNEIVLRGHEVGLHGYTHDSMARMSEAALNRELDDSAALLESITGCQSALLRPPGGSVTQRVKAVAAEKNLAIVTWSVDPKDWATEDTQQIVKNVVSSARSGDVILLHDMSDSSVDAALEIIDQLAAKGFQFVTVSRLAQLTSTDLELGKIYSCFYGAMK